MLGLHRFMKKKVAVEANKNKRKNMAN